MECRLCSTDTEHGHDGRARAAYWLVAGRWSLVAGRGAAWLYALCCCWLPHQNIQKKIGEIGERESAETPDPMSSTTSDVRRPTTID